jgi:hypothetical protein
MMMMADDDGRWRWAFGCESSFLFVAIVSILMTLSFDDDGGQVYSCKRLRP